MNEPRDLVLLTKAERAITEAKTLDEVKDIRDRAAAVKAYAKKARLGQKIVVEAAAIKLRAERRLGEMIQTVELADAAPGNQYTGPLELQSPGNDTPVFLRDLGITKTDSSRSQRIAELPKEVFERYLAENADTNREPTVAALLRLERQQRATIIDIPLPNDSGPKAVADLNQLIQSGERFSTIYADPPWPYSNQATRAVTNNHYPTMTLDAICAEPVAQLCKEDAHLHLWTTNGFLLDAFKVMAAWGFEYKSCFIWVKPQIGISNYWRVSHEFLLFGLRGSSPFLDRSQRSWIEHERTEHSRKPAVVRELIERVSPGPYLEMYGREDLGNPSWTVYGNQVVAGAAM
jgi:N6-adenosine-specific RNA methylase IME4